MNNATMTLSQINDAIVGLVRSIAFRRRSIISQVERRGAADPTECRALQDAVNELPRLRRRAAEMRRNNRLAA